MTIKLLLLKSGEDVVADIDEISFGEGESKRIVGYTLNRPCAVKMKYVTIEDDDGGEKQAFQLKLAAWMPLSAEENIPICADWVITMVDPIESLLNMYVEDVVVGKQTEGREGDTDTVSERRDNTDQ